jgi:hypothetical protein
MNRYFMLCYKDPSDPKFPVQYMQPFNNREQAEQKIAEIKAIGTHKELEYFVEEHNYEIANL